MATTRFSKVSAALLIILFLGLLMSPKPSAQGTFLGSCTGDDSIGAEKVVFACTQILTNCAMTIHGADCYLALYYRGQAEEKLEKTDAAERDYRLSIKIEPGFMGSVVALDRLLAKLGNPDYTTVALDSMVREHPNNSQVLNRACYTRAVLNRQLDVAQKDCDQALRIAPDDYNIFDSRCLVRFRTGDFANALGDCDAALRGKAELPSSLYVRGLAKIRLGYTDMGQADITAALALDPKIAETYAAYGVKP